MEDRKSWKYNGNNICKNIIDMTEEDKEQFKAYERERFKQFYHRTKQMVECPICGTTVTNHYLVSHQGAKKCRNHTKHDL